MANSNLPLIASDVSTSLTTVANEWERFVGTGSLSDGTVRQVIAESWMRCRERGISPHEERARSVISPDEITAKLHTENLGLSGKVVLDSMAQTVEHTSHVVVLADATGRILYSVGHNQIRDDLEDINFMPGSEWSEAVAGPNGVGTPLALGKPELVMGAEHFCQGWQPWVCYGAPIRNPSNNAILGCVDITGPSSRTCTEAMALSISIAQSVEANLSVIHLEKREYLRQAYQEILVRWPSDSPLMLDECGNLVEISSSACQLLNTTPADLLQTPFDKKYPDVWIDAKATLRDGLERDSVIRLRNSMAKSARCIIKPVEIKGERLGCALIFRNSKGASKTAHFKPKVTAPSGNTSKYTFDKIIGNSDALMETLDFARIAAKDTLSNSVLISGATGTGKELVAHAIHSESSRSNAPFIAINCAALPKDLIESELFGYAPGAFTGAKKDGMKGKFESANTGTIFLDEIDSLDLDLQGKFLRILDDMQITRIGEIEPRPIDVRVIAATGVDLTQAVADKAFREDLFHRINVMEISLPPLSERGEDIHILAKHFLDSACIQAGRSPMSIAPEVKEIMQNYHWPGNIRELNNVCSRWILSVKDNVVTINDLDPKFKSLKTTVSPVVQQPQDLKDATDILIQNTLKQTNGNISKAARILNINRATIYRRSKEWQK